MADIVGFKTRYPKFKNVAANRLDMLLTDAMDQISKKYWRRYYEQGVYALMAHLLVTNYGPDGMGDGNEKPAKDITSKSAGEISIGYGSARSGFENTYGSYASTTYGQRYLELLSLIQPTLLIG